MELRVDPMAKQGPVGFPIEDLQRVRLGVRPGYEPSEKPPVRVFIGSEPAQYRPERVLVWSIEQSFIHHYFRTEMSLFPSLKKEVDSTVQMLPIVVEDSRGASQHCSMCIMTTGVHSAIMFRREGQVIVFLHWQGVHVASQENPTT